MEIYRDFIAGVQFARPDFTKLVIDEPLTLVWEQDNKYDARAIRIDQTATGQKLGYIKKIDNLLIHNALADGNKLGAKLTYISPLDGEGSPVTPPYESLVVAINVAPGAMTPPSEPISSDGNK